MVARGQGAGEFGLLLELQTIIAAVSGVAGNFPLGRALLTGFVVITLTAMLWALMIAVATDEEEREERVVSLGAAFAWVLFSAGVCLLAATYAGAPVAIEMLVSIQIATLATLLAVGGVEVAWSKVQADAAVAPGQGEPTVKLARQMASFSARLAMLGTPANDREPR